MRITPLADAVATAHKRVMVDHEGFNGLTVIVGVTNIIRQEQQRVGPMSLWMHWWNAIWRLRPAFSRLKTFLWFATAVAGFAVRTDMLGVTSIVRALNLDARCYNTLIDCFHSSAVKLDRLTSRCGPSWCCGYSPSRCASTAGDPGRRRHQDPQVRPQDAGGQAPGISSPKQIPSPNSSRGTLSLQAVSLLVQAASSFFAVPLAVCASMRNWCGPIAIAAPCSTKSLALLGIAAVEQPF